MVKSKAVLNGSAAQIHECPQFEDTNLAASTDIEGPYSWSPTQQGLIVSLYFAGYLVGMFPAGYFADRYFISGSPGACVIFLALRLFE